MVAEARSYIARMEKAHLAVGFSYCRTSLGEGFRPQVLVASDLTIRLIDGGVNNRGPAHQRRPLRAPDRHLRDRHDRRTGTPGRFGPLCLERADLGRNARAPAHLRSCHPQCGV